MFTNGQVKNIILGISYFMQNSLLVQQKRKSLYVDDARTNFKIRQRFELESLEETKPKVDFNHIKHTFIFNFRPESPLLSM
jgi:hypothetical protein